MTFHIHIWHYHNNDTQRVCLSCKTTQYAKESRDGGYVWVTQQDMLDKLERDSKQSKRITL